MKVFLQSIFLQLLLTPYIGYRGYQALPPKRWLRWPFIGLLALELAIFLFGFCFIKTLPDQWLIPIYYICNTWYIASLYLTMALCCIEVLRFTHRRWPWFPQWVTQHLSAVKGGLFVAIALGVTALMIHANWVVNHPVVRHQYLTIPKQVEGRDSLTIVMMTDLHIGEMISNRLVRKYVALSNAQHPDLVVWVGDWLDYESLYAEKAHVEEDLRRLEAPLGVYAVNGNHEYRANRYAKYRWIKKTGATLLIDSVAQPDSTFYLIGRDDLVNKQRHGLQSLLKEVDRSKPLIVLDHQPLSFSESVMNQIDLTLCGHTHNGQFWPYPLVMKLLYECPYGYYRRANSQFYVSSGIGFAGPPYRVGTRSELVVLHIRFG